MGGLLILINNLTQYTITTKNHNSHMINYRCAMRLHDRCADALRPMYLFERAIFNRAIISKMAKKPKRHKKYIYIINMANQIGNKE